MDEKAQEEAEPMLLEQEKQVEVVGGLSLPTVKGEGGTIADTAASDSMEASESGAAVEAKSEDGAKSAQLEIDQWKQANPHANLEVLHISAADFNIQLIIGPDATPFQLFANEKWHTMFLSSSSPQLEEFMTPINVQIEEQAEPFSITKALNMISLAVTGQNPVTPAAPPPRSFSNFAARRKYSRQCEQISLVPTEEDWSLVIMPEVEKILRGENFMPYEIEEWKRRVTVQLQRGDYGKALDIIRHDILGGAMRDGPLAPFLRTRYPYGEVHKQDENKFITVNGSADATERIQNELNQVKALGSSDLGFSAGPSSKDLYHWNIRLFGFKPDSQLTSDITEWALKHTEMDDKVTKLDQDIVIEMKFPSNYPAKRPQLRIIKPRFKNLPMDLSESMTKSQEHGKEEDRGSLTMSTAIEKDKEKNWNPNSSIVELIQQMRAFIIDSGVQIDLESGEDYCLPTVGGFWRSFRCCSPQSAEKQELENGGKIILPMSALEELSQSDLEKENSSYFAAFRGNLQSSTAGPGPWIFELSADDGKKSFVGVEEFTAEEGTIVVPQWMLDNLGVKEGTPLQLRRVKLPKGDFLRLQPHTADFLEVNDTKAMLEWVLPRFTAITVGDTIVVPYLSKKYAFNVLEVKPGRAISIVDSDLTTDFAPPLNAPISSTSITSTPSLAVPQVNTQSTLHSPVKSLGMPLNSASMEPSGTEGIDYNICDHCKHHIPVAVYNNHTLSCMRRNWFCEKCNDVVEKSQKEKHMEEWHSDVLCHECGQNMESSQLSEHLVKACPRRVVTCHFCPLQMPHMDRYEHEKKCGTQTMRCEKCNKYVQKREFEVHQVECGTSKAKSTPPRRPVDVLMCPVCQVTFVHLDDLQVHMLVQHEEMQDSTEDQKKPDPDDPMMFTNSMYT